MKLWKDKGVKRPFCDDSPLLQRKGINIALVQFLVFGLRQGSLCYMRYVTGSLAGEVRSRVVIRAVMQGDREKVCWPVTEEMDVTANLILLPQH